MRIMDIGSRLRYEAIEAAAGHSEPEDIQLPAAPELPVAPVCECKDEDCPWEDAVETYTDEAERAMTDYANTVDAAVSNADSPEEPDRDALEAAVSAWGEYVIREVFRLVRKRGTSWAVEVEARNALVGAGIGVARPKALEGAA